MNYFFTGQPSKFHVKTINSGTGVLNAHIEGPSKVAISCTEVDDGYEFAYTPMAAGDYLVSVKYSNVTLAGMPTMATVSGNLLIFSHNLMNVLKFKVVSFNIIASWAFNNMHIYSEFRFNI